MSRNLRVDQAMGFGAGLQNKYGKVPVKNLIHSKSAWRVLWGYYLPDQSVKSFRRAFRYGSLSIRYI